MSSLTFLSFIKKLVDKYSSTNGRNAESPIRMFKYLLLKTIYTVSDVDVVERSAYDMSFKYFLEMTPEEAVINPSSLTKFRKLRLKDTDLLDLLINKTVVIAIEKGIIRSKSIIVDATHTLSRSNPFSAVEVL
jgi:transposase